MRNSIKSLALGLACVVAVVVPIVAVKAAQISVMIKAGANPPPMTETIGTFTVETQQWPNVYRGIGTVEASEGIVITAEVPGKVKEIALSSGAQVKKGAVLLTQESENERAQLNAAEARLRLATSNYERIVPLREKNTVSQSELDNALQQLDSAQGEVDNLKATLEKKIVRAPFDGRLGIRQVDLGQDLQVGTAIVSLQATNAVRVNFPVPQAWVVNMDRGLPVEIDSGDDTSMKGFITAIGAEINPATRNAMVQSYLQNDGSKLIPGMAVKAIVTLSQPREVLAVPTTAVVFATFGDTVFVIEENDKGELIARQQFVKLGKTLGDFVEILDGVSEGQKVAAAGAFRLRNGQQVVVSTLPMPEFSETPTPSDS